MKVKQAATSFISLALGKDPQRQRAALLPKSVNFVSATGLGKEMPPWWWVLAAWFLDRWLCTEQAVAALDLCAVTSLGIPMSFFFCRPLLGV